MRLCLLNYGFVPHCSYPHPYDTSEVLVAQSEKFCTGSTHNEGDVTQSLCTIKDIPMAKPLQVKVPLAVAPLEKSLDSAYRCTGSEIRTPFGILTVISQVMTEPLVLAAAFSSLDVLAKRLNDEVPNLKVAKGTQPMNITDAVSDWVETGRDTFATIRMQQPGGEFMQACWKALRTVNAGEVVTYAQLAAMAGRPKAVRAAGTACSSNLIAPLIPCHRVVKSDWTLGQYGYGVDLKARLLVHEGIDLE